VELDKKFTPTGLDCSRCWKNNPKANEYLRCPTRDKREHCSKCFKNCQVVKQCGLCFRKGQRGSFDQPAPPSDPPMVSITADAEVYLLPPCSRPTAEVVKKGNNHLHFIFGFPKCPCCKKKPEKRSIEDCDIEIRKPKRLNVEDCDIEINKSLNIEDCGISI